MDLHVVPGIYLLATAYDISVSFKKNKKKE